MSAAKQLISQEVVKDMSQQNLNILREILLTDPIKINSAIDIWTKRKHKATNEEAARCDRNIQKLLLTLETVVDTTMKVYNISVDDTTKETEVAPVVTEVEEKTTMVHQPPIQQEEAKTEEPVETHTSDVLRVVRDVEDPREKYKDLIKSKSIDELSNHFKTMPKEEATEAANFILGKGLYKSKKGGKPWQTAAIAQWLTTTVFKEEAPVQTEAVAATPATEDLDLEEKYKDIANTLTLAEIGEKIRTFVKEDKYHDALEMSSYLLSKGLYIDAQKEPLNWNEETIAVFIDQSTSGLSSEVVLPEAEQVEEEAPFWDITYKDFYRYIDDAANKEGATVASVKGLYKTYLCDNVGKSIETIDEQIKLSNVDEVWQNIFAQTIEYRIKERNRKAEQAKFEAENVEVKDQILDSFIESDIKPNKEKLESDKNFALKAIRDIKKLLIEKGWVDTSLQDANAIIKDLARRAAVNVKYFQKKDVTTAPVPSSPATETTAPENVAIIGPEIAVDKKYPEIEDEVAKAKYLEDVHGIVMKYNEPDKVTTVLQLITNAFLNKQIFEKSSDTEALNWNLNQVHSWLETLNQPAPVEAKVETPAEAPVVDAQTDISTEHVEEKSEETVKSKKTDNPFYKIKHKEEFIGVIVDTMKKLKEEGKEAKAIRSYIAELIVDARTNDKKSFARNSYKKATPGELFNMINKVAINANIEGFMNEHKE